MAKAARILNQPADEKKYAARALKIKNAFNAKYLNTTSGIYDKGYQTELSVPLYWGIVPDSLKRKVAANLAKKVQEDNYQLDVGILGAKAILGALSENGYTDVAYTLASRETYPSWGWWIANGATTLYENWKIESKSDISLNHIMFGEIGAWLYKGLGGIKPDEHQPGFKHVLLTPHFVKGLSQFSASHVSPYGPITSAWKSLGGEIIYKVTIPANCSAELRFSALGKKKVYLSGKRSNRQFSDLPAGEYLFSIK